ASLFFVVPLARALLHRQITRRDLLRMVVLGQLTFSLYFWLQYTGVQQTNASISSILVVGLIPVLTALLAQLLGKERLSWMTLSALLLGFVGVAFIVFQRPLSISLASGFLLGVFCLVGNALAFAAYSAYNSALSKIDASRAAVYIYFEPVVAVLFGVTLLGEPLSWQVVVGALSIAGSVAIVNLIKR